MKTSKKKKNRRVYAAAEHLLNAFQSRDPFQIESAVYECANRKVMFPVSYRQTKLAVRLNDEKLLMLLYNHAKLSTKSLFLLSETRQEFSLAYQFLTDPNNLKTPTLKAAIVSDSLTIVKKIVESNAIKVTESIVIDALKRGKIDILDVIFRTDVELSPNILTNFCQYSEEVQQYLATIVQSLNISCTAALVDAMSKKSYKAIEILLHSSMTEIDDSLFFDVLNNQNPRVMELVISVYARQKFDFLTTLKQFSLDLQQQLLEHLKTNDELNSPYDINQKIRSSSSSTYFNHYKYCLKVALEQKDFPCVESMISYSEVFIDDDIVHSIKNIVWGSEVQPVLFPNLYQLSQHFLPDRKEDESSYQLRLVMEILSKSLKNYEPLDKIMLASLLNSINWHRLNTITLLSIFIDLKKLFPNEVVIDFFEGDTIQEALINSIKPLVLFLHDDENTGFFQQNSPQLNSSFIDAEEETSESINCNLSDQEILDLDADRLFEEFTSGNESRRLYIHNLFLDSFTKLTVKYKLVQRAVDWMKSTTDSRLLKIFLNNGILSNKSLFLAATELQEYTEVLFYINLNHLTNSDLRAAIACGSAYIVKEMLRKKPLLRVDIETIIDALRSNNTDIRNSVLKSAEGKNGKFLYRLEEFPNESRLILNQFLKEQYLQPDNHKLETEEQIRQLKDETISPSQDAVPKVSQSSMFKPKKESRLEEIFLQPILGAPFDALTDELKDKIVDYIESTSGGPITYETAKSMWDNSVVRSSDKVERYQLQLFMLSRTIHRNPLYLTYACLLEAEKNCVRFLISAFKDCSMKDVEDYWNSASPDERKDYLNPDNCILDNPIESSFYLLSQETKFWVQRTFIELGVTIPAEEAWTLANAEIRADILDRIDNLLDQFYVPSM